MSELIKMFEERYPIEHKAFPELLYPILRDPVLEEHILATESYKNNDSRTFLNNFINKDTANQDVAKELVDTATCLWFLDPVTMELVTLPEDDGGLWMQTCIVPGLWYAMASAFPTLLPVIVFNSFSNALGLRFEEGGKDVQEFMTLLLQQGITPKNTLMVSGISNETYVYFRHPDAFIGDPKENDGIKDLEINGKIFEGVKALGPFTWGHMANTVRYMPPSEQGGLPEHEICLHMGESAFMPGFGEIPLFLFNTFLDSVDERDKAMQLFP